MHVAQEIDQDRPRPGEFREPLLVELDASTLVLFRSECHEAEIAPERAYSLMLERRLLLDDLYNIGLADPEVALDRAAAATTVSFAVGGVFSAYLRGLARPSRRVIEGSSFLVPVPLRLHARAQATPAHRTVERGALRQALAWERATVVTGRTMAEWGSLVLLAEQVESQHTKPSLGE